ncbi:MAG: M23 family metallopeptidase [Gammaproteobacteria bacterium]|nr:M23 family metallopeptidase [Gammaproteobacteria bacterium]
MNIILLTKYRGRPCRVQIDHPFQLSLLGVFLLVVMSVAGYIGYETGITARNDNQITAVYDQLMEQREVIAEAKLNTQAELDALVRRSGQLQAHVIRLNALGQKVMKLAKMDPDEFDFSNPPALGGPSEGDNDTHIRFDGVIDDMFNILNDREQELTVLENVLVTTHMAEETSPEGRPIKRGWISSFFGMRTNPFSGKSEMHKGMDFAGKMGSKVYAVAGGVVTWSGPRYGYGNLVEISHGNGYVTRYGHNASNLVVVGEAVKKGHIVSLMGSTGRSTGPHVHFEVLKNGKRVDPLKFVQARY